MDYPTLKSVVVPGRQRCKPVSMLLYMYVADRHTINTMHV